MASHWISLVLSLMCLGAYAVLADNEPPVPDNSDCSDENFIHTGGMCDSMEHRQIQDICREIRQEIALVYHRVETGYEAADGLACFGDVLLDKSQALEFLQALRDKRSSGAISSGVSRKRRKVDTDFHTNKWPTHIYYEIASSVTDTALLQSIHEAMAHLEKVTCLRFSEYDKSTYTYPDRLEFVQLSSGCKSYLGKTLNKQPVFLSYYCNKVVVMHEIAHALGFIHEHQRSDSNDYITINEDKIPNGYESNFYPYSLVTSLGFQYDYTSLMHYPGRAGLSWYTPGFVIETNDPRYQRTIGQRVELSYLDAKAINHVYCSDTCDNEPHVSCDHHGYQDPNDCSRCVCPDGWEGKLCETLAKGKDAECGGTVTASSEPHYLETPGYSSSNLNDRYYSSGMECTWLIKAPQGYHVKMDFVGDFGIYDYGGVCYHWVEIRADKDTYNRGPRFCNSNRPSVLTSSISEVMVLFRSQYHRNYPNRGFRLKYWTDQPSCSDSPCQNDGVCQQSGDGFYCQCQHGFQGDRCEHYNYNSYADMDLVLMIDQHENNGKDFNQMKALARRLFTYIDNPSISLHRGAMTFSMQSIVRAPLANYQDLFEVTDSFGGITTSSQPVDLYKAFDTLVNKFYTGSGADRPKVSNVAVMILDSKHGLYESGETRAKLHAELAEKCIEVMVVAIGNNVEVNFLEEMVGKENVVHYESYQELTEPATIHNIITKVKVAEVNSHRCLNPATTTTEKTTTTTKKTTTTTTTTTEPTTTTTTTTEPTTTTTTTTEPTTTTTTTTTEPTTTTTTTEPTTTTTTTTTEPTTTTTTTEPTTTTTTTTTTEPTTTTTTTEPTTTTTTTQPTTTTPKPTTTPTTTTQAAVVTTEQTSAPLCTTVRGPCDHECGGCGYLDVIEFCYENGIMKIKENYKERCNRFPCSKDCSIWNGIYIKRTCYYCCPNYYVQGDICV